MTTQSDRLKQPWFFDANPHAGVEETLLCLNGSALANLDLRYEALKSVQREMQRFQAAIHSSGQHGLGSLWLSSEDFVDAAIKGRTAVIDHLHTVASEEEIQRISDGDPKIRLMPPSTADLDAAMEEEHWNAVRSSWRNRPSWIDVEEAIDAIPLDMQPSFDEVLSDRANASTSE